MIEHSSDRLAAHITPIDNGSSTESAWRRNYLAMNKAGTIHDVVAVRLRPMLPIRR
jgi:hypothetical protein